MNLGIRRQLRRWVTKAGWLGDEGGMADGGRAVAATEYEKVSRHLQRSDLYRQRRQQDSGGVKRAAGQPGEATTMASKAEQRREGGRRDGGRRELRERVREKGGCRRKGGGGDAD